MHKVGDIVIWYGDIDTYGLVIGEANGYYSVLWFKNGTSNVYPGHNLLNLAKMV